MVKETAPNQLNVERLRLACLRVVAALIAFIAVVALSGWVLNYGTASTAVRQSVPMHPTTAFLLLILAGSLWLGGGHLLTTRSRIGMHCAAFVFAGGIIRLWISVMGVGPSLDRLMFPPVVNGLLSARFTMAPLTSTCLSSFGAALFIIHLRPKQYRLPVYVLTLIPALISLLTISRCLFVNLAPQSLGLQTYPVAISAAISFLLLAGGIAIELSSASFTGGEEASSLANKLAVGFGAAVFVLCGIGVFSYQSIAEFIEDSRCDNHTYQVMAVIDQLYASFKDAEGSERGFIITDDSSFLQTRQLAIDSILPLLAKLQYLTADNPIQQQEIEKLKPLIAKKLEIVQTLTVVRRDKGFEEAKQILSTGPAVSLMEQIHTVLIAMTAEEKQLLDRRMIDTQTNARRGIVLITLSAIFALVLVLGAGWMLNRDIGGRERAEQALRSSESLFRGLLQSAPDAMVITNEAGKIELVNARAEQLFGYPSQQLIGQPIELIIPPVTKEESASGSATHNGTRKDGSQFPVEITHSPAQTSSGQRISTAIRDVTQLRDEEHRLAFLNSALSESNTQLEAANKELESFSYSVSHDLRAPLRSIDGFSQAVIEDYADKLDAEGQDHLHRVRAATQRMGQLIDDLLNLSRVTRAEMNREQVDLSKIARDIADELRSTAPEQEVELVIADNIVAYTDARLIRIVLTNLLNNAWKFTAKRQRAHIEFGYFGENGKAEYFVRDNGAGFDPAYSSRLFGAFSTAAFRY